MSVAYTIDHAYIVDQEVEATLKLMESGVVWGLEHQFQRVYNYIIKDALHCAGRAPRERSQEAFLVYRFTGHPYCAFFSNDFPKAQMNSDCLKCV